MLDPTRYEPEEDDDDSLAEVLSALVSVFRYLGLFILVVAGCIAAVVLDDP